MANTPNSSLTAYAAYADLRSRYDVRAIQQLCSDNDIPVDVSLLSTNERLAACLLDASGMVEAACGVGNAYRPEDLQALTGVTLGMLKRLVCNLTIGLLWLARPDREGEPPETYKEAKETLEEIRNGRLVFGLIENQETMGSPEAVIESVADPRRRNGPAIVAERFFGTRVNQIDPPSS